jgi:hypothetical protein
MLLVFLLICRKLDARYEAISREVIGPFREWKAAIEAKCKLANSYFALPFDIISKIFWPKERIGNFFAMVKKDEKTGDRYYKDEKRHHKTDGIILTPNISYQLKRAPNLFKWKYNELQTIGMIGFVFLVLLTR